MTDNKLNWNAYIKLQNMYHHHIKNNFNTIHFFIYIFKLTQHLIDRFLCLVNIKSFQLMGILKEWS